MKKSKSKITMVIKTVLTLLVSYTLLTPIMAAYTTNIDLGDATSFAVLGGSAVTSTGPTVLKGTAGNNVGVYPGTSLTEVTLISMTGGTRYHASESQVSIAQTALTAAYLDAAGRTPSTVIPTELGNTTLVAGVYTSTAGTFGITGTLILDGKNDSTSVFIFQMESTLVTANNSMVQLINGADYCNIFWQVGSSATLGTNSHLGGHILALESITATTGAIVHGSLLARDGAVTLDSNTITNNLCNETTTPSPLPNTASPLEFIILMGGVLVIAGVAGLILKKKDE
ncbi:MAG: DUF3494 domain-containing protein [Erysipelothrix sp.]|jgi:hypothetical protein|nr:DUF3494 domain-containing protein [Erysipelothrix sp.]